MSASKPPVHPLPSIPLSRRDLHKLLLSLGAMSWATPALAGIDFDAMFADHTASESWRASYLMLAICEIVYGDPATRSKRWELLGLSEFGSEKSKETSADMVVVRSNKHLFLAYRGSKGWKDMLADTAMGKIENVFGDFKIHSGFANQALALREFTKKAASTGLGDRKLWLVGHSLGGAVAQLLAYDLRVNHKFSIAGVVTCGGPKLGNDKWQDAYNAVLKNQTWRWINQHDPVPHLPKGKAWDHVGRKNVIRGKKVNFDAGDTPDAGDSGDHPVPGYLRGIRKHMPDSKEKGLPNVKDIEV